MITLTEDDVEQAALAWLTGLIGGSRTDRTSLQTHPTRTTDRWSWSVGHVTISPSAITLVGAVREPPLQHQ